MIERSEEFIVSVQKNSIFFSFLERKSTEMEKGIVSEMRKQ